MPLKSLRWISSAGTAPTNTVSTAARIVIRVLMCALPKCEFPDSTHNTLQCTGKFNGGR